MPSIRTDVFFYGLFMDLDLLRDKGVSPESVEPAYVTGFTLRIGSRASLVPDASGRVFGVIMSLTVAELERLYSEPAVQAYKPHAVLAHLKNGPVMAALCYILPEPPSPAEYNSDYAAKLRLVAQKIGLPADYVASF